MVLFVLRKLILQKCMQSHPVALDVWFLVGPFICFHTSCVRTVKALVVKDCAGSSAGHLCDKNRNLKSWLKYTLNRKAYEPGHEKMCLMSYANNKGVDQPAHPRSLISTFVVRCLDSIIFSRFYSRNFKTLVSFCGCAGWFVSGLVRNSRRHVFLCCGSYKRYKFKSIFSLPI